MNGLFTINATGCTESDTENGQELKCGKYTFNTVTIIPTIT